uniref:Uncharacterized protein n=1 Tax=Avena sativa TaxID=4498 RepID=A0ACD5T6I6_AVESA
MLSFGFCSMRRAGARLLAQHNTMAAASFLVVILLAAANSAGSSIESSNGSCILAERAALLSFKAGITSDPDDRLASWQRGHHDCCRWRGVTCSSRTGHVVKLDLRNRYPVEYDYEGYVYSYSHSLHGQVSSSLLSLRHSLRHLDLSGNYLLGDAMAMPGFLGSLKSLTYLNLSNMGFHGTIPPQLGNLSKLVHLDIGNQYDNYSTMYSGKDISWLLRLHSLQHLNMASIDLSRAIDWVYTINALPNLAVLVLRYCGLNISNTPSSLPHHNLTVLQELDLSFNSVNNLAAHNWLWDVTSLKSLKLRSCESSGTFPDELGNLTLLRTFDISWNNIKGMIPRALQKLCNLKSLRLDGNNIGGDITEVMHMIPNCSWKNLQELGLRSTNINGTTLHLLSNLTSLSMLDVSQNGLSASVPMEIGTLANLTYLNFADNNLSGSVPKEIGMLENLVYLDLRDNNFLSGSMPVEIGTLTNLTYLDLGGTNLSGLVPVEIGMLTNLAYLDLGSTNLSGLVPVEIGMLTNLTYLDLGATNLSGVITEDHFAGLMNLKTIQLSYNNLKLTINPHWVPPFNLDYGYFSSCLLGPQFPKWLRWQTGTIELDISYTGLVGRLPDWFWTTFSDAKWLDISWNQLSGELPLNLDFMSANVLLMHSNQLTGLIPKLPRTIESLDMSRNSLNGFASNFQAPGLRAAILFSNSITGTIPTSICQMQKLVVLDLSHNMLSAGLPDCGRKELKQWNPSINNSSRVNSMSAFSLKITTLLLSNNSLSSGFPLLLRECRNLIFLDLSKNKFTGELPRWISKAMPGLVILSLRSNNFSGRIPIEIMELQVVRIMDLSNNNFYGAIPQYLENLKVLADTTTAPYEDPFEDMLMDGYDFHDAGLSMVIKGQVLEYVDNIAYLMTIDLSCNHLTGEIPVELGSLVDLISLNLSSNLLSGNIPHNIGNIRSLESLDLSKNKLSGEIPLGLSDLTSLSYLNLSYNNLSGTIPSGRQLDTLKADDPASMYIGNPGLCGHPVPRQCPGPPGDGNSARWSEDGLSQMDFLLGSIVGFVAGTWMVFCGLLFMKRWRYAYVRLVDKLYDRLYVVSVVAWRKWSGTLA